MDRNDVESDIARTYQGGRSCRGELCYQVHMAMTMPQPSFEAIKHLSKNERCISSKFEQNSENKKSAYLT